MARESILDPRSTERRLLECRKCFEPVASSAWAGRVAMRCGYCGLEDERELVLPEAASGGDGDAAGQDTAGTAYRDTARPNEVTGEKLRVDLGALLPGHRVDALTRDRVRAAWNARAADDSAPSAEWEPVWMSVWMGHQFAALGNPLLARVTLETALENTRAPAYRALLIARLAQHAGALRAIELAEKWLAACPTIAIAEIESEIRAAELLIAVKQGKLEEVRRATGGDRAGDGFVGNAMWLAIALNIAAQEGLGHTSVAEEIFLDLRRKHLLPSVLIPIAACGLTKAPLIRMNRTLRRKHTAISIGAVLVLISLALAGRAAPADAFVVASLEAVPLTLLLAHTTYTWRNSPPNQKSRAARTASFLVGLGSIVAIAIATANGMFP